MNSTTWMEAGFGAIARAGAQAAMLGLIVLVVQFAFRKKLPPKWRYLMWAPVVLRLLFPVLPESSVSLFNLTRGMVPAPAFQEGSEIATQPSNSEQIFTGSDTAVPLTSIAGANPATQKFFPWRSILPALSAAGALVFALCFLLGTLRLARRLTLHGQSISDEVNELFSSISSQFGVRQQIQLIETREVDSPALFGLIKPKLLLPAGLLNILTETELGHVFAHECAHLKRRDLWSNALLVLLQAIHWWNPFVWFFFNRIRADRELACDHLALSYLNPGSSQDYGRTLLRLLEGMTDHRRTPALVGILEEKSQLKERIRGIAGFRPVHHFSWLAAILLGALILTGLSDAQSRLESPAVEDNPIESPEAAPGKREDTTSDLIKAANSRERERTRGATPVVETPPRVAKDFRLENEPGVDDSLLRHLRTNRLNGGTFTGQTLDEVLREIDQQIRIITGVTNQSLFRFQTTLRREDIQKQFGDRVFAVNAVGFVEHNLGSKGTFAERVRIRTTLLDGVSLAEALNEIVRGADSPIGYSVMQGFVFYLKNFPDEVLTVEVTVAGEYIIAGRSLSLEQLSKDFSAQMSPGRKPVNIRSAKDVPYSYIVKLVDLCRENGVINVSFARNPTNEAAPAGQNETPANDTHENSSVLVQDARLLMELGKLDEAEGKLREAVKTNPEHEGAYYYLTLINERRLAAEARKPEKIAQVLKGADQKPPTGKSLRERVESGQSRSPELIQAMLETIIIPEFGILNERKLSEVIRDLAQFTKKSGDQQKTINFVISSNKQITIDPLTGRPIEFQSQDVPIEDYQVKIDPPLRLATLKEIVLAIAEAAHSPGGSPGRKINVGIEDYAVVFSQKLENESLATRTFKVDPNTFEEGIRSVVGDKGTARDLPLQEAVMKFFSISGVDFNPDQPDNNAGQGNSPRKAIFYNDRTGILFVRATKRDLDTIEGALSALITPPLVKLVTKVLELPLETVEQNLGSVGHMMTNKPFLSGLLNEAQHQKFINALDRAAIKSMVLPPNVTTVSGRTARTPLVENGRLPGQPVPSVLDFRPDVAVDGYTIELSVAAIPVGKASIVGDGGGPKSDEMMQVARTLFDGQTLILGAPTHNENRLQVILVTPKIIDPAGNHVYEGDDRPYDQRLFPRQRRK